MNFLSRIAGSALLGTAAIFVFPAGLSPLRSNECKDNCQTEKLVISGVISRVTYEKVVNYVKKNPGENLRVKISSAGGDARYAILIGDVLFKRNTFLEIYGICHSACAQYILPSARLVSVMTNASVAFHSSPSDLYVPIDSSWEERRDLNAFSEIESAFYKARGIDPVWLMALRQQLEPICFLRDRSNARVGLQNYAVAYNYAVVVPSRKVLMALRLPAPQGYWPSGQHEVDRDAKLAGFSPSFRLKFVDRIPPNTKLGTKTLPECADISNQKK